ncbi:MAG: hypothetical protein WAN93_01870 [Solirubrobacteraceae bacterium]
MGVGLAALTTHSTSNESAESERPWHAPFFILAVQLIGFAIVGIALYIVAWSVENGHSLAGGDLRAENRLIVALALLIVVVAIRNAWTGFANSSSTSPWGRGLLERVDTSLKLFLAVLLIVLLGLLLDEVLLRIGASAIKTSRAIPLITVVLVFGLGAAFYLLRRLAGGDPSVAMPRRQRQCLLGGLDDASGSWISVRLKPIGELEPDLAFSATVWSTDRGWYWQPDDAFALARYHSWAANHARTPVAALHLQRVSVIAGTMPDAMRGMRITRTTRRLWWIDARRSHREQPPLISDAGSPERKVGLVHIAYEQLQAAGLIVTVGPDPVATHHAGTNGAVMTGSWA